MNIVRQNEGSHDRFSGVSGGFGPALAAGCPGVELMSRYTNLCFGSPVRTEAGRTLTDKLEEHYRYDSCNCYGQNNGVMEIQHCSQQYNAHCSRNDSCKHQTPPKRRFL